jgi:hypothetical protein
MFQWNVSPLVGPSDVSSAIPGTPPPAPAAPAPGGPPPGVSRLTIKERWRARSQRARQVTRWKSRVVALIPELDPQHHPIRHDINDGDIQETLDVAIQDICLRMTPLSPQERQNPGNRAYTHAPLADDVALACGGRILAVVFATATGPVVHRFFPSVSSKR